MKRYFQLSLAIVLFSLFSTQLNAQNLIPNAGFEYHKGCPDDRNHFITIATGWFNGSYATPDFYHPCGEKDYKTPSHRYGTQIPYEGEAYAGLYNTKTWREYIVTRLKAPLVAGESYEAAMYVCSSDTFSNLPSDIGLYFSKVIIQQKGTRRLDLTPQIISSEDTIIYPDKWKKISGTFIAKGGEKFVTIGSFRKNPKTLELEKNRGTNTYLYIDNPSTTPVKRPKYKFPAKGQIKKLDFVYFQFDKAELLPSSNKELNKLAAILKDNKTVKIEIIGHTDNFGDEEHNIILSEKRALAVANYLIQKGASKDRVKHKGLGSTSPIAPNESIKDRQLNRRVEFRVID